MPAIGSWPEFREFRARVTDLDPARHPVNCDLDGPNTFPNGYGCFSTPALYEYPNGICWPSVADAGCCDARGGLGQPSVAGLVVIALVLRRRTRERR